MYALCMYKYTGYEFENRMKENKSMNFVILSVLIVIFSVFCKPFCLVPARQITEYIFLAPPL